jgi:hypothetical protein
LTVSTPPHRADRLQCLPARLDGPAPARRQAMRPALDAWMRLIGAARARGVTREPLF